MTLEKIFRPYAADKLGTHLQEGFMMGWIPGIITSLDDPEKLNRVQCSCPLIDPSLNMPNIDGQWCWRTARFTLSGIPGGSVDPLQVGVQVILIPMLGDLRYLAVLDCLYSKIDQMHPLLNPAKQIYGSVSLHEVINMHNDKEQSSIIAYPHGVLKAISGTGDIVNQTKGGASSTLKQDGSVLVQNPKSSMVLDPKGRVAHHNALGARSVLKEDGQVEISNSGGAKLELLHPKTKLTGPAGSLGGLFGKAKKLKGIFGKVMSATTKLNGLDIGNIGSTIAEGAAIYAELSTGAGGFSEAFSALKEMQFLPVNDLAMAINPQVVNILEKNISQIARDLSKDIENFNPNAIALTASNIAESFGIDLGSNEQIIDFADSMRHSPEKLIESLTSNFLPNGFEDIEQIAGLGLLDSLDYVNNHLMAISDLLDILDSPEEFGNGEEEQATLEKINELLLETKKLLPWNPTSEEILNSVRSDFPIPTLLSYHQKNIIQETIDEVSSIEPIIGSIDNTRQVIEGIRDNNLYQIFTSSQTEDAGISNIAIGNRTIGDLGRSPSPEASLGDLFGDINPHIFNLDLPVKDLIHSMNLGVVNLSKVGINEQMPLSDILSGIDLGSFDLSSIINAKDKIINLSEIKISRLLGNIPTAEDISKIDPSKIKFQDIFDFDPTFKEIPVKDVLLTDSSSLGEIPVKDILPDAQGDVNFSELIGDLDLGGFNPKDIPFTQLAHIDTSSITPSTLKIPLDVGQVTDSQLKELWRDVSTVFTEQLNKLSQKALGLINNLDQKVPSGKGGTKVELKSNLGEMISEWGNSKLFVTNGRVGASSPKGRFGFGGAGGGFFTQGSMVAAVTEKFGRYASGMFLSPSHGMVLSESPAYDYENPEKWEFNKSKIQVVKGKVIIASENEDSQLKADSEGISIISGSARINVFNSGRACEIVSGNYSIAVNSVTGVSINGVPINNLIDNYNAIIQRLTLIEEWQQQQSQNAP